MAAGVALVDSEAFIFCLTSINFKEMQDKAIERFIKKEAARQKQVVNLIASENYVSADVLAALGSVLTNKYAEGYSGRRYYGGNEVVDQIESLCQERALRLFGLKAESWSVNVQALSGSPANLAVYLGLVPVGQKIMGMGLAHGGHLTHGHKVSATGKLWQWIHYGVERESERLNYEALQEQAVRERPALIVAGFTAYPRRIDFKKFREIADACPNSQGAGRTLLMVDMSHLAGLVAGGAYPSPFKYADVVTTTAHKTLRGPRAALIFARQALMEKIDRAIFPGLQGGPHVNQIAATAVALAEAARPQFKTYAKQVVKNAQALAAELKRLRWRLVSGGTDSHLLLMDVFGTVGLGGKEASERLERAGIIVNKNTIPFDERSPADPSGLRLGTAAETTRGKKEKEMKGLAQKIDKILRQK
jgi:glycine hydroxymethyltransferase